MPVLRLFGAVCVTSRPLNEIRPPVGSMKPAIIRRSVVLPHPDGPRRKKSSPGAISKETPATARTVRRCVVYVFSKALIVIDVVIAFSRRQKKY